MKRLSMMMVVLLITSCASPGKGVLPQDKGASMVDVYRHETKAVPELSMDAPLNHETVSNPYTKVAIRKMAPVTEIIGDAGDYYKPVNNIRMRIFIYPHRIYNEDGEESIVPSYYTYYPLYAHQHYYLPNEAY